MKKRQLILLTFILSGLLLYCPTSVFAESEYGHIPVEGIIGKQEVAIRKVDPKNTISTKQVENKLPKLGLESRNSFLLSTLGFLLLCLTGIFNLTRRMLNEKE